LADGNGVVIEGRQVDYIFLRGEPWLVAHGEFRLQNRTAHPETCTIQACHIRENDKIVPLEIFWIYCGETLLERSVALPSGAALDIRVTFAPRAVYIRYGSQCEVRLAVECGGRQYDAVSRLNIIQEK